MTLAPLLAADRPSHPTTPDAAQRCRGARRPRASALLRGTRQPRAVAPSHPGNIPITKNTKPAAPPSSDSIQNPFFRTSSATAHIAIDT